MHSAVKKRSGSRGSSVASGGLFGRASSLSRLSGASQSRFSEAGRTQTKDPRPVTDRGYQIQCAHDIYEFMMSLDYKSTKFSAKSLTVPAMKDFFSIFEFLYGCVKPSFRYGGKPEDEIPKIMKHLRYPYTLARSMMLGMGSRHTWGNLLGLLVWMIGLAKVLISEDWVRFSVGSQDGDNFEGPTELELLHDVVASLYGSYIRTGQTDPDEDARLLQQCVETCFKKPNNRENLEAEGEKLMETHISLRETLTDLQSKAIRIVTNEKDTQKLQEYFGSMDNYFAERMETIAGFSGKIKDLEDELAPGRAKRDELQTVLDKQTSQANQLKVLLSKKINLEEQLESLKVDHGQFEKTIVDKELKFCKLINTQGKVNKQACEIHEKVKNALLDVDENLAARMPEQPLQISLEQLTLQTVEDLNDMVRQGNSLLTELQDKRGELENELVNSQGILEEIEEFWMDAKHREESVTALVAKEEAKKIQLQQSFETKVCEMDLAIQQLNLKTEGKKNQATSRAEDLKSQIKVLQNQLEEKKTNNQQRIEEMELCLQKMMDRVTSHRAEMKKENEEYMKYMVDTLRDLGMK